MGTGDVSWYTTGSGYTARCGVVTELLLNSWNLGIYIELQDEFIVKCLSEIIIYNVHPYNIHYKHGSLKMEETDIS